MKLRFGVALSLLVLTGCATLAFQRAEVRFEDPAIRLGVVNVAPTPEEAQGIRLRMLPPEEGVIRTREEMTLYQLIREGRGLKMVLRLNRSDQFSSGSRPDSFVMKSETLFEGTPGEIVEEVEITERGEIVKFIQGMHRSKIGKFKIVSWSRTPIFPETPVKIGDKWSYDEMLETRLESRLVKEKNPEPYIVKATSTLTGFAILRGVRCAVIETMAFQRRREVAKVLWKEITLEMHSNMAETAYLDYQKGTMRARVTRTASFGVNPETGFENRAESQSLYSVLP